MRLTVHIDGGSRGNPGLAGAGVVLRDRDSGLVVKQAGYFIGKTTNNVAEYEGLIKALEAAIELDARDVEIFSDSQLMVRQINGEYRVKSADLKPRYQDAMALLGKLDTWKIEHVYREENKAADELANLAMDAKADVTGDGGDTGIDQSVEFHGKSDALKKQKWAVEIVTEVGPTCPAGVKQGNEYVIGATMPNDFCVFAAGAVLDVILDVKNQSKRSHRVRCAGCGASIRIKRV